MPRAPDYQKERGQRQEQRILGSLAESPKTSRQLADLLSVSLSNISIYTRRLRSAGQVHIAGYESCGIRRPAPQWGVGALPDAEYVPTRCPVPVPTAADRLAQARQLLKAGHTSTELGKQMSITRGRAQKYIQMLREPDAQGRRNVQIIGWRHPGKRGDLAPIYKVGCGEDTPKPRETRAERYRKEVADPDKRAHLLSKRRAQYRIDKARQAPQPWFAALMGVSRPRKDAR